MISYSEALLALFRAADQLARTNRQPKLVPLLEAQGCRLAQPLVSGTEFPAFDASLVDGFAVRCKETESASPGAPIDLLVLGQTLAGESGKVACPVGSTAHYISTGAPFTGDFDAIVKIEDVECDLDPHGNPLRIRLTAPPLLGANIRYRGCDVSRGQQILSAGTLLDARHIVALAALGFREVPVHAKPRVAIVATGDELDDSTPIEKLPSGKIRNATTPFLTAALKQLGCEVAHHTAISDNPQAFARILKEELPGYFDIVVTTGGVSMGKRDFIANVLTDLRAEILFHRVAAKPGKPILAAQIPTSTPGGALFTVCLPGNPLSTVVGMRFFINPFLRHLLGAAPEKAMLAKLGNSFRKPKGMRSFYLASVRQRGTEWEVFVKNEQDSFRVLPLARSNAWVTLPEVCEGANAGDTVEVFPLFDSDTFREDVP